MKIEILTSDSGGEYVSKRFQTHLCEEENELFNHFSYTAHQNEIAESE